MLKFKKYSIATTAEVLSVSREAVISAALVTGVRRMGELLIHAGDISEDFVAECRVQNRMLRACEERRQAKRLDLAGQHVANIGSIGA